MTPKRWLALLAFYISYLLFGASIYYHIENGLEIEKRAQELQKRIEINELLVYHLTETNETPQDIILEKVSDYCDKPVTNYTLDDYVEPYKWSFYHSLFFAFTICSTVGYGNLSPSTTLGQMIMIIYSLIGIPINGILFAGLGDFFSRTFTSIYEKYKNYKMSNDDLYVPRQLGLFATVLITLIPGITFFIILPSLIFSYFEGWPYTLSIYFSYVTTTTIGFGDYVPTFQPKQERDYGLQFIFYQIFVIIWFIFALGYVVMIMTFITKGLRSKKLAALEHQLSVNIKATQNRIWHGVVKDVGYLRRILNELYLMKFRPVYHEPGDKFTHFLHPRSASCPDLTIYRETTPIIARKRAFSENLDGQGSQYQIKQGTPLIRIASDTDLDKINKQKTFETAQALMQTTNLLGQVVTALSNLRPSPEDVRSVTSTITAGGMFNGGYHNLTDSEILASEKTVSGWSVLSADNTTFNYSKRGRASSDFHLQSSHIPNELNEWTWAADNNQIQKVINKRVKTVKNNGDLYRASFQTQKINYNDIEQQQQENQKEQSEGKSFLKIFKPITKRLSVDFSSRKKKSSMTLPIHEEQSYSTKTVFEEDFKTNLSKQFQSNLPTPNRRQSLFSLPPSQNEVDQEILENTTIADLIRAIEVMHTHATLNEPISTQIESKRKLGTASLSPPKLPPLFTLFPQTNNEQLLQTSYSRRSTIFGSLTAQSPQHTITSRRLSVRPPINPPPYTEREITTPKFKRRFSVRPTNLQTPPGKAPPVNIASKQPTQQVQTVLQRKLSLRPSPLARELPSVQNLFNRNIPSQSSLRVANPSQYPLSRIAQLQATRKGSFTPDT